MKNLVLIIFILFLIYGTASPQSCLPEGITFSTQEQIDYFQMNYPGCTEIEGDVEITGDEITNLYGLNVLTVFWGDIRIYGNGFLVSFTGLENITSIEGSLCIGSWENGGNPSLISLTGLYNVTSIGGSLEIWDNDALTSLSGLDNVTSIGGDVEIGGNAILTSLIGLDTVTSIGGHLRIDNNVTLTSLTGLDNVTSIGGYLWIYDNNALTSLMGLGNVTSIGGDFKVYNNNALTSLTGLDNIDAASIDDLLITFNSSLSTCEVQSVCDYLAAPNGNIEIYNNATGCSNPEEVEEACMATCLPEGITFSTQAQIDNFQTNYPGCTEIEGDVEINGNDITNLNGLNVLTAFWGDLVIYYNIALTSLSGLDNVTSIGGDLYISGNAALTSLSDLNNVNSIAGDLWICYNAALTSLTGLDNMAFIGGFIYIGDNNALTSLTGLDNVTSIGGDLEIWSNDALTDLSGLDNINAASIDSLFIRNNTSLSTCEVQSICDYLISPTGTIQIYNNAPGCNSQQEVEEACTVSVESTNPEDEISIFPNPANKQLTISSKDETTIDEVIIYNQTGQIVLKEEPVNNIIDISQLQPGLYIIEVVAGQKVVRGKLVVE